MHRQFFTIYHLVSKAWVTSFYREHFRDHPWNGTTFLWETIASSDIYTLTGFVSLAAGILSILLFQDLQLCRPHGPHFASAEYGQNTGLPQAQEIKKNP